jgi:hypothetical protein
MMFNGKLTQSAGALILMGALAACGGGGDSITPAAALSPLGQLVISNAPTGLSGTFEAEDVSTTDATATGSIVMVVIDNKSSSTPFVINLEYNSATGAVRSFAININGSLAYECSPLDPCSTAQFSTDATGRIMTLTNATIKASDTTTVTLNGRIQWKSF